MTGRPARRRWRASSRSAPRATGRSSTVDSCARSGACSRPSPRWRTRSGCAATNAFSALLEQRLHERDPERSAIEIRVATDLAAIWIQWAITNHLRDDRPLSEHFDEVFRTTLELARQLEAATNIH